MSTEYKPLFNRTYLKILVVGCVLAILWLSSLGKPDSVLQGQITDRPLYWLDVEDTDPQTGLADQLQVILPSESAFSGAAQDRQQWRALILRERLLQQLGNQYRFEVQVADDYLSFTLFRDADALPELPPLMDALSAPVESDQWQAQLKQVEARRYLNERQPEQQLLARLGEALGPQAPLPLNWQQLFSEPRYLLAGPDAEERAETLAQQLPEWQQPPAIAPVNPLTTTRQALEIASAEALLLLASPIPARNHADIARQQLIAATSLLALERYPVASGTTFRLRWKSLEHGGYQAAIFFSPLPLNNAQLQAFRDKITPALVDEARPGLKQRLHNPDASARWQLESLQRVARYQLPLDALAQYSHALDTLDSEAIAQATRQRFDPDRQFSLRIDHQP